MQKKEITRYNRETKEKVFDDIAEEYRIKLFVNEKEILSFATYPLNIDELFLGFLFSEGMISSLKEINYRKFDEKENKYHIKTNSKLNLNSPTLTSGCAKGTTFANLDDIDPTMHRLTNYTLFLEKDTITNFMGEFQKISDVFMKTGAVHVAALANTRKIEYYYEDIGRHNAIDKVLGRALLDGIQLNDKILLSTGRISSEIISKVIISGVPIIISRSAPTSYAIDLGEKFGLTIVGFCRGARFNVYTHASRIK